MQEVIDTYVDPLNPFTGQPIYHVIGDPVSVYTPETDYGAGLTQGVTDLDNVIRPLLDADPDAKLVIVGYSMSDSIVTQEMINLANSGAPDVDGLKFVLAENLNNPNGGIFERFPGMFGVNVPATPSDTPYDTTIYTIQYSGASDFPQYPSNIYADLNAANGYLNLHPYLLTGWPAYFNPSELANAVAENTSAGYDGNTEYFIIPTQDLPLLDGMRLMPGAPSAFADLIQPNMRVLVDLGYDWTGNADVTTAADWTSPTIDVAAVDDYLVAGANQGMIAALVDLGILPQSDLPDLYPYLPDIAGLQAGLLTDDALAATYASESANALISALATSSSPLASELSAYLPGAATQLAEFFQSAVDFISF
jgi:hypothetical protein